MAHLSGIQIGKQARSMAVALALGAVVLSLTPGQTAYAARGVSDEAGEVAPDEGSTASPRKPKPLPNPNDLTKCTITTSDGTIHYYIPGDVVIVQTKAGDKQIVCGSGGQWIAYLPAFEPSGPAPGPLTSAP